MLTHAEERPKKSVRRRSSVVDMMQVQTQPAVELAGVGVGVLGSRHWGFKRRSHDANPNPASGSLNRETDGRGVRGR
eukprot:1438196-Rhodomonas_salina.4